jgi:hypothetical protein
MHQRFVVLPAILALGLSAWSGGAPLETARFGAKQTTASRTKIAFRLSDTELLPEDIEYDPASKSFLLTSVREHKIVRAWPDGVLKDFASSPDGWPMMAIKLDVSHNRVWATEVALEGLAVAPASAWGRSAVLCFDLRTGKLLQRIEGPRPSSLSDMALSQDGEPIVSDGKRGKLYRVKNRQILQINTHDLVSPQTAARIPFSEDLFVPDYLRGIARVSLPTGRLSWLGSRLGSELAPKIVTNGIDGLYLHDHDLLATQNGTSPERVVLFALNPALTRIISMTVVEQSASPGCDPTHGVLVGDIFYYIAHSGWARLDEHGKVRLGMAASPALVMSYRLSGTHGG